MGHSKLLAGELCSDLSYAQTTDCVQYQGKPCFVFGRRSSGYFDLRLLDGSKVHASASSKHLKTIQKASACLVERRSGIPPTAEPVGILPQEA